MINKKHLRFHLRLAVTTALVCVLMLRSGVPRVALYGLHHASVSANHLQLKLRFTGPAVVDSIIHSQVFTASDGHVAIAEVVTFREDAQALRGIISLHNRPPPRLI